ncbi:hypothetical protein SLS56_011727 [Neofusicoccum ribis]|uniref:DUF6924 domain-containing protein n=1 Tax=Neofusicoccum ribis TaxID=45134 RepID=A0ABR3SAW2_9PEZI
MPEIELFPVCCTAEVPASTVNKLLDDAHAGSERLAPGSPRVLAVATSAAEAQAPTTATLPPVQQSAPPFPKQTAEHVAQHVGSAAFFVLLDERSVTDDTAVLAARRAGGAVDTVRVAFSAVQHLLASLDMATMGFAEIQSIAEANGGVYGGGGAPRQGGPAPRKRLGG